MISKDYITFIYIQNYDINYTVLSLCTCVKEEEEDRLRMSMQKHSQYHSQPHPTKVRHAHEGGL